jgi:tetratricopeptide (TPR) repeat protein
VNGSKASAIDLVDRYVAEIGSQSPDLKFPAIALKRRISEGLPSRHLVQRGRNGDFADSPFITPAMVGRATELAALQETFGQVRAGASHCMVVAGEAGIGKTRLVAEFSATAVLQGARVERVTIQPHDGERPMGAFVDLVPGLLRARGALGCSPASMDALRNLIGRPASGDLPQQAAGAEEHEQRWAAVSRAVVDLCEAIASEGTLVLVIEDAHWLDTLSAQTIGRVIGAARESRIMIVVTTRDSRPFVREMRLTERCQTVTLGPLDAVATNELLDFLLPVFTSTPGDNGPADKSDSVRMRIAEVSAGNPLFLISLATHSQAHPGEFTIPGTIVETFAQRIDALSRRAISVLATCAELGKHSNLTRLMRSLEMRKHEVVESLLELADRGLVLRNGRNAVPAHPLVTEALRGRLPQPARGAVAHAVAATLEADAADEDSPSMWWDAAESWRSAGDPERAINALRRCAQHAIEIGRPGEAAGILYEVAKLPQSTNSLRLVSEELLRSASAAGESRLVLHAAEIRRSVVKVDVHDDFEIAELRAAIRADLSSRAVERLLACIESREASSVHKIDASLALLKGSETLGSDALRERVIATVSPEDLASAAPLKRLEFRLLVAVLNRDWTFASQVAEEMLSACALLNEDTYASYVYNASAALLYGGRLALAIEGFQTSYAMAAKMGSPHNQLASALVLQIVFFDSGMEADHRLWHDRCLSLVHEAPHLANDFDLLMNRALVAFYTRDAITLDAALKEADSQGLFSSPVRARWRRALTLGGRAVRYPPNDRDEDIARTILSERFSSLNGVRDLEVAVACEILALRGKENLARRTLEDFLTTDRGHLALLSPALIRAMESTGLRDQPQFSHYFQVTQSVDNGARGFAEAKRDGTY